MHHIVSKRAPATLLVFLGDIVLGILSQFNSLLFPNQFSPPVSESAYSLVLPYFLFVFCLALVYFEPEAFVFFSLLSSLHLGWLR